MKKIAIILTLLLTACAPVYIQPKANAPLSTPASVATYPPEVCSFLATAQAGCPVTNPVTATLQPLPATSSPTPTVSPSSVVFNPYDYDTVPLPGVYEVGMLYQNDGSLCKADDYTVSRLPNNYLPATCWAEWYVSGKAALNWTYTAFGVLDVGLKKLGESDWAQNYIAAYSNGECFDSGCRNGVMYPGTPTHPNSVHITAVMPLKLSNGVPQWYGVVDTLPNTANEMSILDQSTMPAYYFQYQSDQSFNGGLLCGSCLMGVDKDDVLPLLGIPGQTMIIPMAQLLDVKVQP